MPMLCELQAHFRDAVVGGPPDGLIAALSCPADAAERLAIYRRHHRESFRRHLRGRYPTVEWLIGPLADRRLSARGSVPTPGSNLTLSRAVICCFAVPAP